MLVYLMRMIRLANEKDIDAIMAIVKDAKASMKENHIDQWQGDYPQKEIFLEDISNGNCYVVEEDSIIGVMCMFLRESELDNEDNYDYIEEGDWLNHDSYVVVHRSAILSKYKGKGYMQQMFEYAKEYALKHGINNLRVDTHKDNLPMRKAIKKYGFVECGVVYMYDQTKRLAFMKVIS